MMKWYVISSGQEAWVPEEYDEQVDAEIAAADYLAKGEGVFVIKGDEQKFRSSINVEFTL